MVLAGIFTIIDEGAVGDEMVRNRANSMPKFPTSQEEDS
jgi:hypothetical protein